MTESYRKMMPEGMAPFASFIVIVAVVILQGCNDPTLKPWHTQKFTEEFTVDKADEVKTFADYLALEDRLFEQLDQKIYAQSESGPDYMLDRYSPGSAADPRKYATNWNRSFELSTEQPRGGVLLLHGMSDSPYALRTLGKALHKHGYWVLGMRMPGHGTAPSGLRHISRHDLAAAVRIGMAHLDKKLNGQPVHMMGYSTGAPLALEFALDALEGKNTPIPSSLILVSPAIGIHPAARIASFKNRLSNLPGLDGMAYLQVQPEFDPFKYNSFATNAADVVHTMTRSVARRIEQRAKTKPEVVLPPVLVFKSTVDATVTTDAVIDNLLEHLNRNRHELVLFDINRFAVVTSRMLIDDPAPLTDRVLKATDLPFSVTLVTNESPKSTRVVSRHIEPFSLDPSSIRQLDLAWPPGVISLSHVALPIAPNDPLYGQRAPGNDEFIFLGQMAIQGERGLLEIPADWMLRLRYNPFYDYLESRTLEWVDNAGGM
jgi:alpha-beta hydrolase superfamily lysophospholipase